MLKCIIVDDELKGAQSLELLVQRYCKGVEVVKIEQSAMAGIKSIHALKPDIIFLDVNMPVHSGFDVLEAIDTNNVFVVFTTAHEEYAIKALRKKAFDYLLKPIDPEELAGCIKRIRESIEDTTKINHLPQSANVAITTPISNLTVPVKDGFLILKQEEIIRVEGSGSYSHIYMISKEKHLVSKSLKELEDQLSEKLFCRCHNSHIVNLTKIRKFIRDNGYFLQMEDGSMAEISRTKKDEVLELIS